MNDRDLIEKIAEVMFKTPEYLFDCFDACEDIDALFRKERFELREKYLNWAKNEEIRVKEQEIMKLGIQLAKAQSELKEIMEE